MAPFTPFTLAPDNAHCKLFTFKEGVLSRLGHDLVLEVRAFAIEGTDDGAIRGSFQPRTIHVVGAIDAGRTVDLDASDRGKIERSTYDDVLDVSRFGEISFTGARASDGVSFSGKLTLHGVTKHIEGTVASVEDTTRATVTLVPSEFGIRPYKAMLGALRVEDRVRVEIEARGLAAADSK